VKTLYSPTSLTVDPLGKFVYVVGTHTKGWQAIAVYTVNPATGELNCIGTGVKGARAIAIEPLGRFAYVIKTLQHTSTAAGVTSYSIDQTTGMLSSSLGYGNDDDEDDAEVYLSSANYLAVDLSGQYLYVAKTSGSVTTCNDWGTCATTAYPAEIRVYSINQTSGRIYDTNTPQGEPQISGMFISPPGYGPLGGVDSHTQFMYMLFNGNLNGLALNQLTGQVTDVGLEQASSALGAAAEPTGKFVFVFKSGYVNGYAIDPLSGKTQVIGPQTSPTQMATNAGAGGTLKALVFASY
jgi:6-phosphogluconolactonase (cycloisomerase 2 family)